MEQALRPPKVAVFEGDWNGDPTGLTAHLLEVGVGIAYSLARSDADLAFLEAMQSIGGQTYIVLPYNEQQFVEDRVNTAGTQWEERYRKVRGSADSLIVCSEQKLKFGNVGDEYAYDMLRGLARLRAAYLDTAQVFIGKSAGRVATTSTSLPGFGAERRAMMFADAFRFSSLSEEQIPAFITEVMERIATLSRNLEPKPEYSNTWGDGLFFVFATVAQAGRFVQSPQ